MFKQSEICITLGVLLGWSLNAVLGSGSKYGATLEDQYIDYANFAKVANIYGYPHEGDNFSDLVHIKTRNMEKSRYSLNMNFEQNSNHKTLYTNRNNSVSLAANQRFRNGGFQTNYINASVDFILQQLIWKHPKSSHYHPRYARSIHEDQTPEAKIIVRVRKRRSRTRDFTQLNKDVCPPSLCRALDERSRGVGGRPRGTGGTVFYQGDIVLDRDLDRVIYPSLTAPKAQRQRNNQGRNGGNSDANTQTRQRHNSEPRKPGQNRGRCAGRRRSRCIQARRRGQTGSKGTGRSRMKRSINEDRHIERFTNRRTKSRIEENSYLQYEYENEHIWSDSSQENFAVIDNWRTQERSGRKRRATMKLRSRLWKNGVVLYKLARGISSEAKRVIQRAIAHIQQRTCIRFREKKDNDTDYIRFISEPGCWSQIGRVGGTQMVSLGRGCESLGTAVHEIVHSLGVWHEQARPDRNRYVRILEENISERFRPDFESVRRRLATDRGYPYDYQSLMHYSQYAFTRNGEPTIQVIGTGKQLNLRIGQRRGLSTIDISQLRDMYKCNQKQDIKETVCHKTWKKHLKTCYKFVTSSPAQFDAAHKACGRENSNLLAIENSKKQKFIDRVLGDSFQRVTRWRTAGCMVNKTMVWCLGDNKFKNISSYVNWARGHPATRTSLVLYRDPRSGRVKWLGESVGDRSAPNHHRLPYICEKPARRKCVELRYRDGRDYRGHLDHTRDGYTCQRWTENYPHNHPLVKESRDAAVWMRASARRNNNSSSNAQSQRFKDGLGSHNKCRNPSGLRRNRPWCYTTKRRHEWGYCDVSPCTSSLRRRPNRGSSGSTASRRGTTRDLKPNRRNTRKTLTRTRKSGRGTARVRLTKRVSSQNNSKTVRATKRNSKTQAKKQSVKDTLLKINFGKRRKVTTQRALQKRDHKMQAHIKVTTSKERVRRRKV